MTVIRKKQKGRFSPLTISLTSILVLLGLTLIWRRSLNATLALTSKSLRHNGKYPSPARRTPKHPKRPLKKRGKKQKKKNTDYTTHPPPKPQSGRSRSWSPDVDPICINKYKDLPHYWRPPKGMMKKVRKLDSSWKKKDASLAFEAAQKGLDELITFFHSVSKKRIRKLAQNAVNSIMDSAYGTEGWPDFRQKALKEGTRLLKINYKDVVGVDDPCQDMYERMEYVGYAHYLTEHVPNDPEITKVRDELIFATNKMFEKCGSLADVLNLSSDEDDDDDKKASTFDMKTMFDEPEKVNGDDVYTWLMGAITLTDLLIIPGLILPDGVEEYIAGMWDFLSTRHFENARDHPKHYKHEPIESESWTVTHSAYLPTGYGRHMQSVEDAPWLFHYIRENYFYAMEYGLLDHISEFTDLLRQYGCTEKNDYQLRIGTKFVLNLYLKSNRSWIDHKSEDDDDDGSEYDYNRIHKPWTAISAVIPRKFLPVTPGTYGYAFQEAVRKYGKKTQQSRG